MGAVKSRLVLVCQADLTGVQVIDDPETDMSYAVYDIEVLNFLIDHIGQQITPMKIPIGTPIPPQYTIYNMAYIIANGKRH